MLWFHWFRSYILPLKQIDQSIPDHGLIYEIGCGTGDIAYYLAYKSPTRTIVGIDNNQIKIRQANKINQLSNVQFVIFDANQYHYQPCSGVIMSDFLHHINYHSQIKILKKISSILKTNGILAIKEIDRQDGMLTVLSRLWDWILYPKDKIYYQSKKNLVDKLIKSGFRVKVTRQVSWFPGSTHLFICQKQ